MLVTNMGQLYHRRGGESNISGGVAGQTHLDYTPSLDGTFKYLAEIVHIPPGPETFGLDAPSF